MKNNMSRTLWLSRDVLAWAPEFVGGTRQDRDRVRRPHLILQHSVDLLRGNPSPFAMLYETEISHSLPLQTIEIRARHATHRSKGRMIPSANPEENIARQEGDVFLRANLRASSEIKHTFWRLAFESV